MAVAFDATSGAEGTTDLSWTHTPAGTPRGVVVLVAQSHVTSSPADEVIGVTYGAVAMTEAPESPLTKASGPEDSRLYAYFLGSSVPTGAQTVAVDVDATGSNKRAQAFTVTAAADTSVEDTATLDHGGTATPSATLATGVETVVFGLLHSGNQNPALVAPGGDYTEVNETDFGATVASFVRRTANAAAGTPVVDWAQTSETAGVYAIAVGEGVAPPSSGSNQRMGLMGVG